MLFRSLNILFPIRVAVPNLRNVYFRKNDLFISAESATGLLALADIVFMLTGKTLESKKTRVLVEDWCAYLEANNLNTATYVNGFKLIDNKIIIVKHDETTHYELTLNETSDRLVTKLVASERVAFSEHTRNFIIAPFLDSSKYHITYLADTFRVSSEDYLKVLN